MKNISKKIINTAYFIVIILVSLCFIGSLFYDYKAFIVAFVIIFLLDLLLKVRLWKRNDRSLLSLLSTKLILVFMLIVLHLNHGLPLLIFYFFTLRELSIIIGQNVLKLFKSKTMSQTEKKPKFINNIREFLAIYLWDGFISILLIIMYALTLPEERLSIVSLISAGFVPITLFSVIFSLIHYFALFIHKLFLLRIKNPPKRLLMRLIPALVFVLTSVSGLCLYLYMNYIYHPYSKSYGNFILRALTDNNKPENQKGIANYKWMKETTQNNALTVGPVIGSTTGNSVKIWVKTEKERVLDVTLYSDKSKSNVITSSQIYTKEVDGFTGIVKITGLETHTRYYYDVSENNESVVSKELQSYCVFETFPEENATVDELRFMITSGNRPLKILNSVPTFGEVIPENLIMWEALSRHIRTEHFDFILLLGDQSYNDSAYWSTRPTEAEFEAMLKDPSLKRQKEKEIRDAYRDLYIRHLNHLPIKKVMASTPVYMIWDDHEFRDGWGSEYTDYKDPITQFAIEQHIKVYEEYQHCFNPDIYSGDKWHYYFSYGDIGFFVPDIRGHRDVSLPINKRPLMGKEQWIDFDAWLEGDSVKRKEILFYGLSIPLVDVSNWLIDWLGETTGSMGDDIRDRWFYKKNRPEMMRFLDKLFQFRQETGNQVYTMGGDVHVSFLSSISNSYTSETIYEFSASGISQDNKSAQFSYPLFKKFFGKNRLSDVYYTRMHGMVSRMNYGVVEVKSGDADSKGYNVYYYVASQRVESPEYIDYTLLFKSNVNTGFPTTHTIKRCLPNFIKQD